MYDELARALDAHLGTDPGAGWRTVCLGDVIHDVVTRAASRFTVGLPLCRDEAFLRAARGSSDALMASGTLVHGAPYFLKPVVGLVSRWRMDRAVAELKRAWAPLYRERLAALDSDDKDASQPFDYMQAILRHAQRERPNELCDLDTLTRRFAVVNFSTMHTTTITAANLVLDILGSDAAHKTIAALRDEVGRVLGGGEGDPSWRWTKANVARLVKADSVARETLRLHLFGARTMMASVMVDGFRSDDGVPLPRGTLLCWASLPPQTDPDRYDDPLAYDPFRFSRMREASAAEADEGERQASPPPPVTFVSTSLDHQPFGHGKSACPGRFLIDLEFKMLIAYLVTHYDVELHPDCGGRRPPNRWMAEVQLPPFETKIRVRRRK